jgi:hypothetical protein
VIYRDSLVGCVRAVLGATLAEREIDGEPASAWVPVET